MQKIFIAFLILFMTSPVVFSDFVLFSAEEKNAEKRWRVDIGKNTRSKRGIVSMIKQINFKSGNAIVLKNTNAKTAVFSLQIPDKGAWRNRSYHAIEVEYKCKGNRRGEMWPYVYNPVDKAKYRYAVFINNSEKSVKRVFKKFWKRRSSPKLKWSSLKFLELLLYKNTEMAILKITLLEGQRTIYLQDTNDFKKPSIRASDVRLYTEGELGNYVLLVKNKKNISQSLTLKIADKLQGPWRKCASVIPESCGSWRLPFNLQKKVSGKYFLSLNSANKTLGKFAFYAYFLPTGDYNQIVLWPSPHKIKWAKGFFLLPATINVNISGKGDDFPLELLAEKLQSRYGVKVTRKKDAESNIKLKYIDEKLRPDGFKLKVDNDGFVLCANSNSGMYYAVRTLLSLIRQSSMGNKKANSRMVKIEDWADTPTRVFFHRIDTGYSRKISVEAYKKMIYSQISGGRYNLLVLVCRRGIQYDSHPEIALKNAISKKEVKEIIDYARKHYVDVAPGGNSPGHANWILETHPELQEETNRWALCMKHPGTLPLLYDLYGELIELFKPVKYFWLGGDEIGWDTHKLPFENQCKLCKGVSKKQLVLEHWTALAKFCMEKGARPILYDDMLSINWNGGDRYGVADILAKLPRYIIISNWGTGYRPNPPQKLINIGFTPWKVSTSFGADNYNDFLFKEKYYEGKGICEFINWPWRNFSHINDRVMSDYTAPAIHVCADTIWNKLTAAGPGWIEFIKTLGPFWMKTMSIPDWGSREIILTPFALDDSKLKIKVGAVPFLRGAGDARKVLINQKLNGLYFLQSFAATAEQEKKMRKLLSIKQSQYGLITANYIITYINGETCSVPVTLGWNVHLENCIPGSRVLQGAECYIVTKNKTAWSFAWKNPRPNLVINNISLKSENDGNVIWSGLTLVK